MALRLYADECVDARIVSALRARGVDIVNAAELGLLGAHDAVHVERATALGRIVISADTDFLAILPADGLLFIKPNTPLGEAISRIETIATTGNPMQMRGRIEWI